MSTFYGEYPPASGGGFSGLTSINADTTPAQVIAAGTGISVSTAAGTTTITNTQPSSGGTVTSVSIVSANGLAGTVATATTTPAITLSTSITGVLKGNGTAISAATAGTDYVIPSGSITGTAANITATSNSTLTTLSSLSLPYSQVTGGPSTNALTALTGDGTATGPGSAALTLATVNASVGSFGSSTAIPSFTVNAKGLVTAASTNVVIAPAGTLTGTTLASNVVTSSLTTLGTVATGTWQGTVIGANYGGTGGSSASSSGIAHVASGVWSYSSIVDADVSASAAIARSKLAAVGPQTSSSSSTYTTTSTSATQVTNLSVTLTTTGRPVQLIIQSDGTANNSYLGCASSISSVSSLFFWYRDGAQISQSDLLFSSTATAAAGANISVPPGALQFVDTGASAASHTYALYVKAGNSNQTISVQYCVIMAFEIA